MTNRSKQPTVETRGIPFGGSLDIIRAEIANDPEDIGYAALGTLMTATEADPNWAAQIPGDSRSTVLGIAPVRATDVQEALN